MPGKNSSSRSLLLRSYPVSLEFATHVSTGTDPKTQPGVGLTLFSETLLDPLTTHHEHRYWYPLTVVDRDEIRKLRNLLTDFLLDFPEEEPG